MDGVSKSIASKKIIENQILIVPFKTNQWTHQYIMHYPWTLLSVSNSYISNVTEIIQYEHLKEQTFLCEYVICMFVIPWVEKKSVPVLCSKMFEQKCKISFIPLLSNHFLFLIIPRVVSFTLQYMDSEIPQTLFHCCISHHRIIPLNMKSV